MKKTMLAAALVAATLVSLSARTERVFEAAEGYKAPEMCITADTNNDSTIVDLTGLARKDGGMTLLHFWRSTDAQSRIDARRFDHLARRDKRVALRAVNLDTEEALFRAIVKRDDLTAACHSHADRRNAADMLTAYGLERQMHSFLIDARGIIVAVDPTVEQIRQHLSN